MKDMTLTLGGLALSLLVLVAQPVQAQQHRATRLGNPATRFAEPLYSPSDLRARFRDFKLRPDIAAVLSEWGWKGGLHDLYQAAETNRITEIMLPVGTRMPFMTTRKNGKAAILRDVLWAGKAPIAAYAFSFTSNGRRYRCVTPKLCSNFFLEDVGSPNFVLECNAPAQALLGRQVEVCFTLRNNGDATEPKTVLRMPVPAGAEYVNQASARELTWEAGDLAPGQAKLFCAAFTLRRPGQVSFTSSASGEIAEPVRSACATRVEGISAILLEVVDLADPVEVGSDVTYVVKVFNQGSATGTNIRLACVLPPGQEFVSGRGTTPVRGEGSSVTVGTLSQLPPKTEASWQLMAKASRAADVRFRVELTSDQFQEPIVEQESTRQY